MSLTISTLKRGNLVLSANQVYKLGALSTKRLVNKAVNEAASLKVAYTRIEVPSLPINDFAAQLSERRVWLVHEREEMDDRRRRVYMLAAARAALRPGSAAA